MDTNVHLFSTRIHVTFFRFSKKVATVILSVLAQIPFRGQKTIPMIQFFLSMMWVFKIKLRFPGLITIPTQTYLLPRDLY